MKVAIIGYKNHAGRILNIIKNDLLLHDVVVFHPDKKNDIINTNNFNDVLNTKCVFVASPNSTHFYYIKKLLDKSYQGKIFCEKPPVTNISDLNKLNSKDSLYKQLYFNFNFRKTILFNTLKDCKIGKILSVNLNLTHGLAFKESYADSWRSKSKTHDLGILETVGIHWIDLFSLLFGSVVDKKIISNNFSENGEVFDTSDIILKHSSRSVTKIFVSYASCKYFNLVCQGTDGVLEIDSNRLIVRSPRDVFDKNGYFILPSINKKENYCYNTDYADSLFNSIKYFVDCVQQNKEFKRKEFENSISSNRFLLNCKKERL